MACTVPHDDHAAIEVDIKGDGMVKHEGAELEEDGLFPPSASAIERSVHDAYIIKSLPLGQRLAIPASRIAGCWTYAVVQLCVVTFWIAYNTAAAEPFDELPFVLLNLLLSFQCEFSASFIMMAQRAGDAVDRIKRAEVEGRVDHLFKLLWTLRALGPRGEPREVLRALEGVAYEHVPHEPRQYGERTLGDRASDFISLWMRSWTYMAVLGGIFATWIVINLHLAAPVDPFPFFYLNLLLSSLSATNSPIVMISTNRQSFIDRCSNARLHLKVDRVLALALAPEPGTDEVGAPPPSIEPSERDVLAFVNDPSTLAQMSAAGRFSRLVALKLGSWAFVALQFVFILAWLLFNDQLPEHAFDPQPFILLNLLLSFQGEFSASFIIMSQRAMDAVERMHLCNVETKVSRVLLSLRDPEAARRRPLRLVGLATEHDRRYVQQRYTATTAAHRLADRIANHMRSWAFIVLLALGFAAWMIVNALVPGAPDPQPFFFLCLFLSIISSENVIILIMSINSQAEIERRNVVKLLFKMDAVTAALYAPLLGHGAARALACARAHARAHARACAPAYDDTWSALVEGSDDASSAHDLGASTSFAPTS